MEPSDNLYFKFKVSNAFTGNTRFPRACWQSHGEFNGLPPAKGWSKQKNLC